MKNVATMFNVRPGEEKATSLMLAHAFFMGLSTTFFETAASALFLTRFKADAIPLVYIGAAIVSILTGLVYSRLRDRISFWALMNTTLVFLAVTVLGFRAGLSFSSAAWLVFGVFLWYRVLSILTDLEYWAVAARIYDVRQSKRLFGLIGSGEVFARTAGSFSIPFLVAVIAVPNLIVLSGIALVASLVLVIAVSRGAQAAATEPVKEKKAEDAEKGGSLRQIKRLLGHPYVSLIFMLTAVGMLGKYFVDFAFLQQMQSRYHDTANIAGFFGIFSGVTQVLNLCLRVFVSGRVLSRWGVRVGLLILPVSHVLCTLAIVVAGVRGDAAVALVFWLVIANQGIYKTMKHPFDNPSLKVLYQPLSKDERLTVQITNEIILTPITIGVAGAIMLLFTKVLPYNPVAFAWIMLATFIAWIVLGLRGFRGYATELVRALKARIVDSVTFTLDDEVSIGIVRSKLDSSNPADVIFSLSLLEKIEHKTIGESIVKLIDHPSAEVRREAALAASRLKVVAALPAIERRLADQEESVDVRSAAIRALALIGDEARVKSVVDYLNHCSHELRREGMVGLLRRGDPRFVNMIRDRISTAIRSADPADRVFAAGVVREAALPDLALVVLRLLKDPDLDVRKAALEACVDIDDRDVLEVAVEAFAEPQLCSTASLVMARAGESVVPLLDAAYSRHPERSTRLRLVRCLGRIGGPKATEVLRRLMDCNDELLRTQVLQSLSMCEYTVEGDAVAAIEERIRDEAAQAAWKLSALHDLPETPEFELLRSSLENEITFCRKRLFLLVSYFGDSKVLLSTRDNYFSGVKDRRAYAIEILDLKMPHRLRAYVLPLLEDLPLPVRLEKLGKVFAVAALTPAEHLRKIMTSEDASAWTRAVAMRTVVDIPVAELVPLVKQTLAAQQAAASSVNADEGALRDAACAGYTDGILAAGADGRMYSTIERVIFLKGVPMFAGASEQILAEIASVLEEVRFGEGELIFHKGDLGNSMYIVISGRARVHDGERTIVHLGDRDVFGELAILDPEPRSADVTAVEETALFRLDRDSFYELMADHVEIVTGVLHVVCQRLRNATSGHRTDDRPPTQPRTSVPAPAAAGA